MMKSWDEWFDVMRPLFELDPLDEKNHHDIAKVYSVTAEYEELVAGATTPRKKVSSIGRCGTRQEDRVVKD